MNAVSFVQKDLFDLAVSHLRCSSWFACCPLIKEGPSSWAPGCVPDALLSSADPPVSAFQKGGPICYFSHVFVDMNQIAAQRCVSKDVS